MNSDSNKKNENEHRWLSMSEAAPFTPYSAEYLSLLARKGKLPAKKIGNTWFTTKFALDEYMRRQMLRVNIQKGILDTNNSDANNSDIKTEAELKYVRERLAQGLIEKIEKQEPDSQFILIQEIKKLSDSLGGLSDKIETIASPKKEERLSPTEPEAIFKKIMAEKEEKIFPEETVKGKFDKFLDSSIEDHFGMFHRAIRTAKNSFKSVISKPALFFIFIAITVLLVVFPMRFVFGFFDDALSYAVNKMKDAQTVLGFRPGTHENEILLLDKNGNVSISGHIETEGQFRSFVKNGVAPIMVDSATKVENLNADYLDNLHAEQFTLAFVTKNGNITTEDIYLDGKVEIGKTLLVKGAAKLLSALEVDGELNVFGDAKFHRSLTVGGPSYFDALLNAKDINASRSITGQSIVAKQSLSSEGNFNVKGQSVFGGFAFFNSGVQAKTGDFDISLGVGGDFSATGNVRLGRDSKDASIVSKSWSITTSGVATLSSLSAGGITVSDFTATNASTTNFSIANNFWSNSTTTIGDDVLDNLIINAGNWTLASSTATTTVAMTSGLNFDSGTFVIDPYSNRIGIGTTTPAYQFDVYGGTGIVAQFSGRVIGGDAASSNEFATLGQLSGGGGPWSRTAPYVYLTTNSDNVGIGTTSPYAKLSIAGGNVFINDNLTASNITATGTLNVSGVATFLNASTTNLDVSGYLIANNASSTITNLHSVFASSTSLTVSGTASTTNFFTTYASTTQLTTFGSTYLATTGGNVGIGTTAPGSNLTVKPSVAGQGITVRESDDGQDAGRLDGYVGGGLLTLQTAGTTRILLNATAASADSYFNTGGNVGIGTTTPYAKLSVAGGNVFINDNLTASNITATGTLNVTGVATFLNASTTNLDVSGYLIANNASSTITNLHSVFASSTSLTVSGTASTTNFISSGYSTFLFASSTVISSPTICVGTDCQTSWPTGGAFEWTPTTNFGVLANSTTTQIWLKGSPYSLTASSTSVFDYASTTQLTTFGSTYLATTGGLVGIGTTEPGTVLDIRGANTEATAVAIGGTSNGVGSQILFQAGTTDGSVAQIYTTMFGATTPDLILGTYDTQTNQLYLKNNGNVGIGTTSPFAKLSVAGSGFFNENLTASNITATGTLSVTGVSTFTNASTTQLTISGTGAYLLANAASSTFSGLLNFSNASGTQLTTTGSTYLATTGGNVGIGTTSPDKTLSVAGDIRVTGTYYSDMSTTSPFTINSTTKVINLNADLLDGFDSSAFGDATAANQTTILNRIGTASDAAAMDTTLFAGQQYLWDNRAKFGTGAGGRAMSAESVSTYTHANAAKYCYDLSAAAAVAMDGDTSTVYTDWRLPTVGEAAVFEGTITSANYIWTATIYEATNYSWILLGLSVGYWFDYAYYSTAFVRCVR